METRLKEIRKAKGYKSAKAFAESIGMQEKTYRNYEQGARNLYLDVACELCTALDCTLDELVGREQHRSAALLPLSVVEEEILTLYRRMGKSEREILLNTARRFATFSGEDKRDYREVLNEFVRFN